MHTARVALCLQKLLLLKLTVAVLVHMSSSYNDHGETSASTVNDAEDSASLQVFEETVEYKSHSVISAKEVHKLSWLHLEEIKYTRPDG